MAKKINRAENCGRVYPSYSLPIVEKWRKQAVFTELSVGIGCRATHKKTRLYVSRVTYSLADYLR